MITAVGVKRFAGDETHDRVCQKCGGDADVASCIKS
jgi:hypothetical protein